jgi:hypothetical protein
MTMFFRIFIDVPHHGRIFLWRSVCVYGTPESVKTKCQIQFAIDRISLNFEEIIHIINMLRLYFIDYKMPYASIFYIIALFHKNPLK